MPWKCMTVPATQAADANEPLYLGRSLDDWLNSYLSAEIAEDISPLRWLLVHCRSLTDARMEFQDPHVAQNIDEICHALPFFGTAFIRKSIDALPSVTDERKQARLVYCIARVGRDSVPFLLQLLKHPSSMVRAAACIGLAEVFDSVAVF
jgi:hypothetical protein